MAEFDKPQEELLKEARRTTHAVRAIARFFLLIVTYEVFAAVFIGLGLAVSDSRSFDDAGEYRKSVLSNNWRNTLEQRRLQVEYPVDALRLKV